MNIKGLFLKHRGTITDYFWRSLQLFGKEGITFFIFFVSAKLLSPLDFGNYNYLMAIIFFLIMFGDFGISTATSKFVAEYNELDKDKLKSVLFNSSLVIIALAITMIVVAIVFGKQIFHEKSAYGYLLLPLVFLAPMTSLYDGIYRGLRRFKELSVLSLATGLPFVIIIFCLIKYWGLMGAFIAQDLFYLSLLIILATRYREWHFSVNKSIILEIVKYSVIIGLTTLSYFFFTRVNVIILGRSGYILQVGSYEILNKIFAILLIPFSILAQVLAPRITQLAAKKNRQEILLQYKKSLYFSGIVSVFVAGVFYLIFPFVAKRILQGYDLDEMVSMLRLLLVVLVTQAVSTVASIGFSTASGHAKLNMYFLALFGTLNVVLTSLFIHLFGFWGVIYSTVIIKASSDISFMYVYFLRLKYGT